MTDRTAESAHPSESRLLHPRHDAVFIPRRHGEILVEPPIAEAVQYLHSPALRGTPPPPWRYITERARADLTQYLKLDGAGHANPSEPANGTAETAKRPWIITGHQVEFYHAGVWAKVLLADHLASLTGGTAIDILVDHDTVDRLGLALPQRDEHAQWKKQWHLWADANAVAADGLSAPDSRIAESWGREIIRVATGSEVMTPDALHYFLDSLHQSRVSDYVPWIGSARQAFEKKFGLRVHHVCSSELCQSPAWLAFVGLWIKNAARWTEIYNQALADYRRGHHVKSPSRPMPPLAVSDHAIELPFWIYHRGHPRERLVIKRGDRAAIIGPDGVLELPEMDDRDSQAETWQRVLDEHQLCIRPRALTLTLYVRTFLADLFIHGIGGAMYDEMTDQIAAKIGMPIGGYMCASAGWLLPGGQGEQAAQESLAELKSRRHHLRHNPQLIYQNLSPSPEVTGLLAERERLIADLAHRPGRRNPALIARRREQFRRLGAINARCAAMSGELEKLDQTLARTESALRQERVLGDREYFFVLHGWESLRQLQQRIKTR
ncbi:MAG: hypothetical protein ACP5O1_08215 [Phycisphaerae bacterium]